MAGGARLLAPLFLARDAKNIVPGIHAGDLHVLNEPMSF